MSWCDVRIIKNLEAYTRSYDETEESFYLPNAWHWIIFVVPNLTMLVVVGDVVNLGAWRFSETRKTQ